MSSESNNDLPMIKKTSTHPNLHDYDSPNGNVHNLLDTSNPHIFTHTHPSLLITQTSHAQNAVSIKMLWPRLKLMHHVITWSGGTHYGKRWKSMTKY
jgi:hypothetical protein